MSKILMIEDDPELQLLVSTQLKGGAHEVVVYGNGKDALPKVAEIAPEVILLDLNLPEMNGFEVLRALRSTQNSAKTPCVIMTALQDPGGLLETAAAGLGAVDFIQKPFKQEDILEVIRDAVAEKAPAPAPSGDLEKGAVKLDGKFRRVWVRGKPLGILPRRRFHLLWLLASREGPVPKNELMSALWQDSASPDANRLEKTVQRLREDLGRDGPRLILTLPGGYEFKSA